MKLLDYTGNRDNNFNLLRIVAALGVLFSHSFALTGCPPEAEPFRRYVGMSAGSIAVDLFFITSGFLVTGSLLTRNSLIEFIWARILRVYPALLVMLLLTVFGLGLYFTTLPSSSFLGDSRTAIYLLKNGILVLGVTYDLPGVFEGNPYKNAVNGSLWTMPIEIRMYALLALAWVVARLISKSRPRLLNHAIVAGAAATLIYHLATKFSSGSAPIEKSLVLMFLTGAAFQVLKARIVLSRGIFWLCVAALIISAVRWQVLFVVYHLVIGYILVYLCFIPAGRIRTYNRIGDYSYGSYIYAFPVQQSVIALNPGLSIAAMFFVSTAVTFILAALSWHLLEKHALDFKRTCVDSTRRRMAGASQPRTGPH